MTKAVAVLLGALVVFAADCAPPVTPRVPGMVRPVSKKVSTLVSVVLAAFGTVIFESLLTKISEPSP